MILLPFPFIHNPGRLTKSSASQFEKLLEKDKKTFYPNSFADTIEIMRIKIFMSQFFYYGYSMNNLEFLFLLLHLLIFLILLNGLESGNIKLNHCEMSRIFFF